MDKQMGILITVAMLIIIGVVLLQTTADQNYLTRTLDTLRNDTFTADNASCVVVTTGCIDNIISIYNVTTRLGAANYSSCRSSTGRVDGIILNSGQYDNVGINATYEYSPNCLYVADTTSKTLLNLIPLFFAIAVMAIGIIAFMKNKEDYF